MTDNICPLHKNLLHDGSEEKDLSLQILSIINRNLYLRNQIKYFTNEGVMVIMK